MNCFLAFCTVLWFLACNIFVVHSLPLVPSRSPYLYVEEKYIKVDNVNISISPIPEKYHNGILLGYIISYEATCFQNSSGQVTVSALTRSYVLTGLLPGTHYYIRVAGFTSTGSGPNDGRDVYTSKCSYLIWPLQLTTMYVNRVSAHSCLK